MSTKSKPKLLDLFCGAGGAGMGYHRAGFEVTGVDLYPQKNYPFEFVQADALDPPIHLDEFDVIHASPPCQKWSQATRNKNRDKHPDLIKPIREILSSFNYVIENVINSPLIDPVQVCGSSFGLPIRRHRLFESSFDLKGSVCKHKELPKNIPIFRHGVWYLSRYVNVYGTGGGKARELWPTAMGIDWMSKTELGQAIPPAYTEFLGRQILEKI